MTADRSLPPDPYAALGVPRDASGRQIRSAYLALMRRHHPDTAAGGRDDGGLPPSGAHDAGPPPGAGDVTEEVTGPGVTAQDDGGHPSSGVHDAGPPPGAGDVTEEGTGPGVTAQDITAAYTLLTDRVRRAAYDAATKESSNPGGRGSSAVSARQRDGRAVGLPAGVDVVIGPVRRETT